MELNKVYTSDCVDFMNNNMDENIVDCVITSPPYDNLRNYNGFKFYVENIAKSLLRVVKQGGVVVWVVGDKIINGNKTLTSFKHAFVFQNNGFKVHDVMIYKKKHSIYA